MATTDYDAPRHTDADPAAADALQTLAANRADLKSGSVDADEDAVTESPELPGADLSAISEDELTMRVVPEQDDEFTCSSCYLVLHRSRLARGTRKRLVCRDCA